MEIKEWLILIFCVLCGIDLMLMIIALGVLSIWNKVVNGKTTGFFGEKKKW